jgi:16S rRNA (guanine527-N7)-methyltransferase
VIEKYFPNLPADQKDKLNKLKDLYEYWNDKINVISRKDIDELETRHILHSLSIKKFIDFNDSSRIIDVGTGGGFPGIPLAIAYPNVEFLLVDSIGKKIKVVNEVIKDLQINNATGIHARAEKTKGKFDFVVTRAVARSKIIYNWTRNLISDKNTHEIDNGIIALKGGDLSEEMNELKKSYQSIDISGYFDDPFFETKKIIYIPV